LGFGSNRLCVRHCDRPKIERACDRSAHILSWPTSTSVFAETIFAAVHTITASWITIHALLNKREVGRAISWIGLAWLSPFAGAVLYVSFGVNRVTRRARRLRQRGFPMEPGAPVASASSAGDARLAGLRLAGDRATGRKLENGNRIDPLRGGEEAYPAMLAAVERAERSLTLSTYIFRNDRAGAAFVAALERAHARGVKVRVLIDGIGGGYFFSPAFRRLQSVGVPAARFLHSYLPWRMPFLNMRTHRKLLVVDGRIAFVGGVNIGAENLSSPDRDGIGDMHFRIAGPAVGQIAEAFADDWRFTTEECLSGADWFPELTPQYGTSAARIVTSGPDQDLRALESLLLAAVAEARAEIRIVTPYFLPDDRLSSALATAAMRGIRVDVHLPEQSDHRYFDWAVRAHVVPLLEAGCQIWLKPPPFDHSKLMTIDGQWSLFGSANWDARSLRLNFELDVEAHDESLAAWLNTEMEANRGRNLTLAELQNQPMIARLRNAATRLLLPYL
jgi:cardiolipin synthase